MHKQISLVLFLIGLGLGLMVTAQFRVPPTRVLNPLTPYAALSDTRDNLQLKQDTFKSKIDETNKSIEAMQSASRANRSGSSERFNQWQTLRGELGLTDVTGEGITILMDDSDRDNPRVDSITHAADLRDVVNLLWLSGAKAISVNNERVVINTSIDCIVNTILINNVKQTTPFRIKAVGNGSDMLSALNDKKILNELHSRIDNEGLVFQAEKSRNITVNAFSGNLPVQFARAIN